ncbi:hypothetical protein TRV_05765 [Trichophyton verrucosum HKI 0517]|uniref:Uncharacterized protein n=1 Tax=Trichophyton verrucosum (strain HKI 0517) TaxID=663202 RepID=D4DF23_TRIVH|nr:uncharacterized protein TRV_05765 [Trichophyton verrucosum HKI 0517]EFE39549.1 hypothetical protein TRV_05765 [Trichophyton verrucosum HKI 0517]
MNNISKTNQGYSFDSRQRIEGRGRKKKSNSLTWLSGLSIRKSRHVKRSKKEKTRGWRGRGGQMTSAAMMMMMMGDNELDRSVSFAPRSALIFSSGSLFLSDDKAEKRRFFNAGKSKERGKSTHRAA